MLVRMSSMRRLLVKNMNEFVYYRQIYLLSLFVYTCRLFAKKKKNL